MNVSSVFGVNEEIVNGPMPASSGPPDSSTVCGFSSVAGDSGEDVWLERYSRNRLSGWLRLKVTVLSAVFSYESTNRRPAGEDVR